jgi:hypothetical protein
MENIYPAAGAARHVTVDITIMTVQLRLICKKTELKRLHIKILTMSLCTVKAPHRYKIMGAYTDLTVAEVWQ